MQDLADIGFIGDGHRLNVTMARSIQFEITTMQPSMWEDVTKPSSKDHTKHLLGIYSALEKGGFGRQVTVNIKVAAGKKKRWRLRRAVATPGCLRDWS